MPSRCHKSIPARSLAAAAQSNEFYRRHAGKALGVCVCPLERTKNYRTSWNIAVPNWPYRLAWLPAEVNSYYAAANKHANCSFSIRSIKAKRGARLNRKTSSLTAAARQETKKKKQQGRRTGRPPAGWQLDRVVFCLRISMVSTIPSFPSFAPSNVAKNE